MRHIQWWWDYYFIQIFHYLPLRCHINTSKILIMIVFRLAFKLNFQINFKNFKQLWTWIDNILYKYFIQTTFFETSGAQRTDLTDIPWEHVSQHFLFFFFFTILVVNSRTNFYKDEECVTGLTGAWVSVNISGLNSWVVKGLARHARGPGLKSKLRLYFSPLVTHSVIRDRVIETSVCNWA